MCSYLGFSWCIEHLRRSPCCKISLWFGSCSILCWWKYAWLYPCATYYPGNSEMGKYAELFSEGVPNVLWFLFSDTTSWGVTIFVSNTDLMERVCHFTNKIYREMLCITRHERMTNITIQGLDPVQIDVSWSPKYNIVLSWDLLIAWILVEGRIPCSFTNFITTPELSGPLYISPDIYHTQITEYSLLTIKESRWALFSLNRTSS